MPVSTTLTPSQQPPSNPNGGNWIPGSPYAPGGKWEGRSSAPSPSEITGNPNTVMTDSELRAALNAGATYNDPRYSGGGGSASSNAPQTPAPSQALNQNVAAATNPSQLVYAKDVSNVSGVGKGALILTSRSEAMIGGMIITNPNTGQEISNYTAVGPALREGIKTLPSGASGIQAIETKEGYGLQYLKPATPGAPSGNSLDFDAAGRRFNIGVSQGVADKLQKEGMPNITITPQLSALISSSPYGRQTNILRGQEQSPKVGVPTYSNIDRDKNIKLLNEEIQQRQRVQGAGEFIQNVQYAGGILAPNAADNPAMALAKGVGRIGTGMIALPMMAAVAVDELGFSAVGMGAPLGKVAEQMTKPETYWEANVAPIIAGAKSDPFGTAGQVIGMVGLGLAGGKGGSVKYTGAPKIETTLSGGRITTVVNPEATMAASEADALIAVSRTRAPSFLERIGLEKPKVDITKYRATTEATSMKTGATQPAAPSTKLWFMKDVQEGSDIWTSAGKGKILNVDTGEVRGVAAAEKTIIERTPDETLTRGYSYGKATTLEKGKVGEMQEFGTSGITKKIFENKNEQVVQMRRGTFRTEESAGFSTIERNMAMSKGRVSLGGSYLESRVFKLKPVTLDEAGFSPKSVMLDSEGGQAMLKSAKAESYGGAAQASGGIQSEIIKAAQSDILRNLPATKSQPAFSPAALASVGLASQTKIAKAPVSQSFFSLVGTIKEKQNKRTADIESQMFLNLQSQEGAQLPMTAPRVKTIFDIGTNRVEQIPLGLGAISFTSDVSQKQQQMEQNLLRLNTRTGLRINIINIPRITPPDTTGRVVPIPKFDISPRGQEPQRKKEKASKLGYQERTWNIMGGAALAGLGRDSQALTKKWQKIF